MPTNPSDSISPGLADQLPCGAVPLDCAGRPRPALARHRGSALLMVMWMSAALAAIAFSLAVSVRGETDHTTTTVDDLRTYYLATGAIQRALMDMQLGG